MAFLSESSAPFEAELCLSSTGSCPADWRQWWGTESARAGSRIPEADEMTPREIARWCRDQDTSRLNAREVSFIEDMAIRRAEPTERQRRWLFIHDKLRGGRHAQP